MPVRFQFVPGRAPDLLDLPWSTPLDEWRSPRLVDLEQGTSRHVVRFVRGADDDERVFALKETTEDLVLREYNVLRYMKEEGLPTVDAVGIVTGRTTGPATAREPLDAVLVTRYLDFSLPYSYLFTNRGGGGQPGTEARLIDAAVILMCRLHLEGFYWGDCSLNNLLFRRDAGALMAYLVDAETSEHRRELSDGMRLADVDLACENALGGLLDLGAAGMLPDGIDPVEAAERLRERYHELWDELTGVEDLPSDQHQHVDLRIRRLNDLGFDVGELVVEHDPDELQLRVRPALVEEGHHARELRRLTGLEIQEGQARHLLNDIAAFGYHLEQETGAPIPLAVVAARWIAEVYEPLLAAVPRELAAKREPPELFHELLQHRYAMEDASGTDVSNEEALETLLADVLPHEPDEQILAADDS